MPTKNNIITKLKKIGIRKNDTLLIHGDSIILNFINGSSIKKKYINLISILKNIIGKNGNIIIPTFTYSFTKTKKFDLYNSKSQIGNFSENIRLLYTKHRSQHPIFSYVIIGKDEKFFLNSNNSDCFGEDTLLDRFHKKQGKIVCLGCGFNRITFAIYVEQSCGVKYRFFKYFSGKIKLQNKIIKTKVRYFVRNTKLKTDLDLSDVKNRLIKNKKLYMSDINRIGIHCVSTKDFFKATKDLLSKNKFAIIEERFKKKIKKSNFYKGNYT